MKKIVQCICFLSFLLATVAGCNEQETLNQTGSITLGVEKSEVLYTKAGIMVTDEELSVSFINPAGDTVKHFEDYIADVKGVDITLPIGEYKVVVSSLKEDLPQWDTPFYYGETTVQIVANNTTKTSVECAIANTKVTVEYTDLMDEFFSTYNTIVTGTSGALTFEKGETRSGFYFTEKLDVTLNLTNKSSNTQFKLEKEFPGIQPRCHYIIKFNSPPGEGENIGGDFDVIINETDSTEIEYTILLPEYTLLSELPKVPEFKITNQLIGKEEITTEKNLAFVGKKGDRDVFLQHKVAIHTQAGIRNLYMKLSDSFGEFPIIFDFLKAGTDITNTLKINGSEEKDNQDRYVYTLDLTQMANDYLTANAFAPKEYAMTLVALDKYHQETEMQLLYTVKPDFPLVTSELSSADKWATFAVLQGYGDILGTNQQFKYGLLTEGEDKWTTVDAKMDGAGNISALVQDLKPGTDYQFKVVGILNNEPVEGDVVAFKTEGTPMVPHMNFDDWYKVETGTFIKKTYWYVGTDAGSRFWDSGNDGANTVSSVNPTSPEYTKIVGGKAAAKLESKYVVIAFAAGNLYTGSFGSVASLGASLDFGQPYAGKPTKLSGHYMYQPKAINRVKAPYTDLKGKQDTCAIYIALCDWEKPFTVNTNTGTFVDFSSDDILAYGSITPEQAGKNMTAYEKFEIDIQYRDITRKPTYILIVASASKYGDYFTGGEGSTLYLDEFELHFDYNPASFKGAGSILEN